MKYISCLAAIGLVQSKTALVIDDAKIVATGSAVIDVAMEESQTFEFEDLTYAL
jgi:hypothetical protein